MRFSIVKIIISTRRETLLNVLSIFEDNDLCNDIEYVSEIVYICRKLL